MVYTSPESLAYIRDCDRDANVSFDSVEEPVSKWSRGRGRGSGEGRGRRRRGTGQANEWGRGGTRGATRVSGQSWGQDKGRKGGEGDEGLI